MSRSFPRAEDSPTPAFPATPMPTSHEIRQQFLDFFVERCGHTIVPSSPVVPHDDPTLLFANAGMNQFKDVFLGVGQRDYRRAVNSQKCIRAGGKHNDLDDVGRDTYHHTFFEMLGNWSFGDYFKAEAIEWAWQLLTEVWGVEPDRLHATYFEGDDAEGLDPDHEARDLWRKFLPDERIHRGNKKDNFWEMGETGPCGPCSEIHYDGTDDHTGGPLINRDDPRVIEIWNLVFIQFNRNPDGSLDPLPARHVDTGMGFERITAVLQGKTSNYDTDVFAPLFKAIREVTGAAPYNGRLHSAVDVAYRVIADHVRTLTFALADGAAPSNEGRGYVLRRILRRAVRYGRQNLNVADPFMHRLVPVVVEQMGDMFEELRRAPGAIAELIREEEESFGRTLDRGIALFDEAATRAETAGQRSISGEDAFRLYDTFGFPLDLTQLMAEERDMTVDTAGFNTLMEQAKQRSRAEGGHADHALDSLRKLVQDGALRPTQFVGYDEITAEDSTAHVVLRRTDETFEPVDSLAVGQRAAIVVDTTPFYAEAGGQVGDHGTIHSRLGAVFNVEDTIRIGDVYFHLGELESPNIRASDPTFGASDPLLLEIDAPRRRATMQHHTTTHLLNWALREVLGNHVQQRGSLVDHEKTRFDFAHHQPITDDEIAQVQKLVNRQIEAKQKVFVGVVPQDEAMKINGLRAVFGEKYPPNVRVVSIGAPVEKLLKNPTADQWRKHSIEFCGGTHLDTTDAAERFVIVSEEGVAKGVRRITAVAGELAQRAMNHAEVLDGRLDALREDKAESLEQDLAALTEVLNAAIMPALERARLRAKAAELHELVKQRRKALDKEAAGNVVDVARAIADVVEGEVIVAEVPGADAKTLRTAMDVIRSKCPDSAMLLAAVADDKIAFLAAVPEPGKMKTSPVSVRRTRLRSRKSPMVRSPKSGARMSSGPTFMARRTSSGTFVGPGMNRWVWPVFIWGFLRISMSRDHARKRGFRKILPGPAVNARIYMLHKM